jgi:hypothetical protein
MNYKIYQTDHEVGHEMRTAVTVMKGIAHACADLPRFPSIEATGMCIPFGNTEMLLVAVYKSPQRLCSDTDITKLSGFQVRLSWQVT